MEEEELVLGLGSNLGDRMLFLEKAVAILDKRLLVGLRRSAVYESPALLPEDGRIEGDDFGAFYNMAVGGRLKARMEPEALLAAVKGIERELGRVGRPKWASREIDIDILFWGGMVYESPTLSIPHKEVMKRAFALVPAAELMGGAIAVEAARLAGEVVRIK